MYPFIGIIMRHSYSQSNHKIEISYEDIISSVIKSKGIPISISNRYIKKYLSICHGFIIQGGSDIDEDNIKIIKLLHKLDKPLLGICLGMQEMGYTYSSDIYDIDNHKINTLHKINILKDSLLYKIIQKEKILVNSRHKSAIKNTTFNIDAISEDNIVEAISDKKKKFFLGLQWHPENMYDIDNNSRKIFDYFIKICNDK